ncbi:SLOG family protein, partial [Oscillospiraceae bacterium 42-9]
GIIRYCAGGALGFDTLAAETVLRLRETYSELRLILVLPCKDQTRGWKAKDVDKYEKIRQRADETVYTSEIYATGCMHKRNRHLVDCSSVCVCYQTQFRGGTAYTVNYARTHGLAIINMA